MFANLFYLQLEEDVNVIIFALNTGACIEDNGYCQASDKLSRLLKLEQQGLRDRIIEDASKIKRLM